MAVPDPSELLAAYEAQVRAHIPVPLRPGISAERDGPLVRFTGFGRGGFVVYRDLEGLQGPALDEVIARQIRIFQARGEQFEWKLHGHDLPVDLPDRLRAAGLVPEDPETVLIAPVAAIAAAPIVPKGVSLRAVTERRDFDRITAMERAVWGDDHSDLVAMFEGERAADPESITIVVAEVAEQVVCAAWIRFEAGTEFATLWGGATLAEWRRRGIYRASVAYRANLAARRGFRFLQVDASDDSRPILERLGFVAVTTTTPYIWSPT